MTTSGSPWEDELEMCVDSAEGTRSHMLASEYPLGDLKAAVGSWAIPQSCSVGDEFLAPYRFSARDARLMAPDTRSQFLDTAIRGYELGGSSDSSS